MLIFLEDILFKFLIVSWNYLKINIICFMDVRNNLMNEINGF